MTRLNRKIYIIAVIQLNLAFICSNNSWILQCIIKINTQRYSLNINTKYQLNIILIFFINIFFFERCGLKLLIFF